MEFFLADWIKENINTVWRKVFCAAEGKYIGERKHRGKSFLKKFSRISHVKPSKTWSFGFWIYFWLICLHLFLFLEFYTKILHSHHFYHTSFPSKYSCISAHTISQIHYLLLFKYCYIWLGFLIPFPKKLKTSLS